MTIQRQTKVRKKIANPLSPIAIDLSKAIKIWLPKLNFTIQDSQQSIPVEFFEIKSENIVHQKTTNRPKGYKAYKTNDLKLLRFVRFSDFLSKRHPYIKFDKDSVEYVQIPKEEPLHQYFRCFRESNQHNAFLVAFPNQEITLFDSELNTLHKYRSSEFCDGDYHLRAVELANDLSFFCFTCTNKAYLLNRNFEIIAVFKVPQKGEYEKRSKHGLASPAIQKQLSVLGLTSPTTQEEIKSVFRKLIYKYHPDRNPDSTDAEEKAKELINAYESLSGKDVSTAIDSNNPDDFYWVNKKHSFSTEIHGMTIEFNVGPDRPEDWIYGLGFSADNSKIYLGCYSGKIYETNFDGSVNKIYLIPEDETCDRGGTTNPLSFIYDTGKIKYILSQYYLYVLENDIAINIIKCNLGQVRWFEGGIILQLDREIILFDKKGNLLGNIVFKTPIKHVCFDNGLLLVELTTQTIIFEIKAI